MPRYTVHLLTPYCTWEDVEAENEEEAKKKCDPGLWPDSADYQQFVAIEED